MKIEYRSNNSGGDWWLTDQNWFDLEKAGWKIAWIKDTQPEPFRDKSDNTRWLGALAKYATREGLTLEQAISEFEMVTGQSALEEGCECCGKPHEFYEIKP